MNERKEAILFLHGWPGSFLEYLDVARILNSSTSGIYDLIIPSLPGYGYSEATTRPGMNSIQMARIMKQLMQRLGYESFLICGGDWGSIIGTNMAQLYPEHVRGLFVTLVMPALRWHHLIRVALSQLIHPSILLNEDEQRFLDPPFHPLNHLMFLW
jgi:juvenile hormone epoxide hydrolase